MDQTFFLKRFEAGVAETQQFSVPSLGFWNVVLKRPNARGLGGPFDLVHTRGKTPGKSHAVKLMVLGNSVA